MKEVIFAILLSLSVTAIAVPAQAAPTEILTPTFSGDGREIVRGISVPRVPYCRLFGYTYLCKK